jgi:very-short-patch-repair endonuclease
MKIYYKKYLNGYANSLRNDSTLSEIILWKELKGKQILGMQFNRQRPIGQYIVDFYCAKAMLIIELDGITHHQDEQFEKDKLRDETLTKLGYVVLRFHDDEVMNDRENVLREIEATIKKRVF